VTPVARLAHREHGPEDGPVALLLHGYPESSFMWRDLMPAIADAGWRAIAPDLAGFGDSEPDPPGTWERHMEAVERFRRELGIERCVLVVHDWGGLIGLRWACEHPEAVEALVISSTGFFADGMYRSGDFEKLAGYRLAELAVPALLVWGEKDEFAPVAGAHRFERELPDTELGVIDDAGHFVWEDAPERCAEAATAFLNRVPGSNWPQTG
jgi:pimeloyl-ACP methyl ester carboxylesterase